MATCTPLKGGRVYVSLSNAECVMSLLKTIDCVVPFEED